MNTTATRKLKEGSRVMWENDPKDLGTVIEVGYNCFKVKWDNGQVGIIDRGDAARISMGPKR